MAASFFEQQLYSPHYAAKTEMDSVKFLNWRTGTPPTEWGDPPRRQNLSEYSCFSGGGRFRPPERRAPRRKRSKYFRSEPYRTTPGTSPPAGLPAKDIFSARLPPSQAVFY